MTRFKYTKDRGMVQDSKGEWVREADSFELLSYWINNYGKLEQVNTTQFDNWSELHKIYDKSRVINLLLTSALIFSGFFNIIQLFYYLN